MRLISKMRPKEARKVTPDKDERRSSAFLIELICSSLLLATPVWGATVYNPNPENSTTWFGTAGDVVGDVNADGVPDLAVGTPFQDSDFNGAPGFGPPQNVGKVYLLSGVDFRVLQTLNDPAFQKVNLLKFGGQLGTSVANAGDIDGDGVPDVIAGAPHHTDTSAEAFSAGEAFAFSGRDGSVLRTLRDPAPEENARLGYAVAGLSDVNGDGVRDILVGAPGKDTAAGADVGVAYIYNGTSGNLIRTLNHPSQGGAETDARFGFAVANAGDLNRDGVSDILVGAPGRSEVFAFSGGTGQLLFSILSPLPERIPSFGYALAGGKDLDGDGIPDFVIGAPLFNRSQGAAYVFNGRDGTLLRKLPFPRETFARSGASLFLGSDVNGDGRADILAGAPDRDLNGITNAGEVRVFSGASGALLKVFVSSAPQAFAGFGFSATAADFNGNGVSTIVVGAPFENANLIDPGDGDITTHLQIGKIETQDIR